jgi:hypothetical protein
VTRADDFSSPTLADRFWAKVCVGKVDECWEWQGAKLPRGYGKIGSGGKYGKCLLATHVSWFLHTGASPDIFVLHTCDNPKCVNPNHLFLGTHQDNMTDQKTKRRHQFGEKHPWAKLNSEQVRDIRKRRLMGEELKSIAKDYGVTFQAISKITTDCCWRT